MLCQEAPENTLIGYARSRGASFQTSQVIM
jgi:hypothetical protein